MSVKLNGNGIPVLMHSEEFPVRVVICQCFRQLFGENVLAIFHRQRVQKLENFLPSQKVASFGVVEVAPPLTDMSLKTTREVIHLDTSLEQAHRALFSSGQGADR